MRLTPRVKQILQLMLQTEDVMTVQELADRMAVSKRTIQRELPYVESVLKESGVCLTVKMGSGIRLKGSEDARKLLLQELKEESYDAGSREKRRKRLLLLLLQEKDVKKLSYYSKKLKVSEATASSDLEAAAAWLLSFGIRVTRGAGGARIQGSEEDYRRALSTFAEENMDTEFMRNIFQEDLLSKVVECMSDFDRDLASELTESAYNGLAIHLMIALKRIQNGEYIEETEEQPAEYQEEEEYQMAEKLAIALGEKLGLEIPEKEIFYIYLHLKGAKHEKVQWDEYAVGETEKQKLVHIVSEMIDAFAGESAWLYKQDTEFLQGLLAHLQPTLIRLRYRMRIQNPVLDSVREEYPLVYEQCKAAAAVLEKYVGVSVPEEEIGFLAVHFGAAQVRMEGQCEKLRPVRVGVVCASGIGVSRLMSSKLKKLFRDRITLSIYGKRDVNPYVVARTDFFVATLPLEQPDIPVIYVNPILTEEDVEQIRKQLHVYERTPEKQQENEKFSAQLEKINQITTEINAVIKYLDFFQVDAEITFAELLQVIGERFSPYRDRAELIKNDLRRREAIASQIFAEFGFALLHSRSRGVVRPGLAICLPEEKEYFLDPYFKNIRVVFVMLIPDDENIDSNGEILGFISGILLDDEKLMETVLRGEKEEIRDAVALRLKQFFKEYLGRME